MSGTVEVRFRAQLDELISGMQKAGNITTQTAEQMRSEIESIGKSSKESSGGLEVFSDKIKEYRTHMRTEGRYARFMAADISALGIASKDAAGEITQFVSAIAFGGSIGLAIEAVKLLVKAFTEVGEESKKQAREIKASIDSITLRAYEAMEAVRQSFNPEKSKSQSAWSSLVKETLPEIRALQAKIDELREHAGGVRDVFHQMTTNAKGQNDAFTVKGTADLIAPLQEQIDAKIKALEAARKKFFEPAKKEEAAHDAKVEAERNEKTEAEHAQRMLTLKAQTLDGEAKLEADYSLKLEQIEDNQTLNTKQKAQEVAAVSQVYIKQVTDYRAAQELASEQQHIKYLNSVIKAEYQAAEAMKKYFAEKEAEKVRMWQEAEKKHTQIFEKGAAEAERVGSAFGNVFQGMISGSQNAAQAISKMLGVIVHEVIAAAIIQIKANAGIAGAEAATSQAAIPFAGPWMAIAAMTMVEGAVLGLLSLASAESGYDIPSGVNPIVQLHQREMVLPAEHADTIRSLSSGGGGGGGDLILNFNGPVDRVWWNSHEDQIVDTLRKAQRKGRWP